MPDTTEVHSRDDGLHVPAWERYRLNDVVETSRAHKGVVSFVEGPIVRVRLINPETDEVAPASYARDFFAGNLVLVNREPAPEDILQKMKAAWATSADKIAALAHLDPVCTRRDRAAHAALIALGSAGVSADDMKRDPEWYAEVAYMLADAMERAATAPRIGEATR